MPAAADLTELVQCAAAAKRSAVPTLAQEKAK